MKKLNLLFSYRILRVFGLIGVLAQMYKWFIDDLDLTANQLIVTSVFVTFVIRPKILVEILSAILNKLKNKNNA
jgi:hypothetical protein|tara:strand:- start:760 stop:981 length:222 start_codon:yes stop_codon:yes gene_type:complete